MCCRGAVLICSKRSQSFQVVWTLAGRYLLQQRYNRHMDTARIDASGELAYQSSHMDLGVYPHTILTSLEGS